jgi:pimeloyl-ACP methyl ester carboxylesterase
MSDASVSRFVGRDALEPAYRQFGEGRPLILLHGFAGTGLQWLEHGPAHALTAQGRWRLILPDLRGHGESPRPTDPASYPPDVLVDDLLALIGALGLDDGGYDLVGYSLGARIALRALVRGARPGRAVLAGQGLAQVCGPQQQSANHRLFSALVRGESFEPGSPDAQAAYWLVTRSGADPRVLLHVLDSLVPTPRDALRSVRTAALVVVGDADHGHASADELAGALPDARFVRVPGDHWFAFTAPEFAQAIVEFLAE